MVGSLKTGLFLLGLVDDLRHSDVYFLARISRGRTVRELCIAMVGGLTVTTWILWTVLGSNTMNVIHNNIIDMAAILKEHGLPRAIVESWATLPFSTFTMWIFLIVCFIATVTLVNACSYTLAMSTCKEATGYEEPPLWVRIGWSILVGIIGLILLALGGLKPLQTQLLPEVPLWPLSMSWLLLLFSKMQKRGW